MAQPAVASQSNGQTVYHVVNGTCDCKDFAKAPHNFCKHRLSAAIARRAQELAKAKLDAGTNGQAEPARPASAASSTHSAAARGTGEHHAQSHPARP